MTAQQKFLLRGQVVDAANDSPVSFATTALLRDSTAVAAVAADAQGRFELSAEAAGDYRLQITMVGYNPETQPVTLRTAATDAGTIRLRQGVDIDQVTVTIQKPLVTADAEKTTYSVEDDPQAASSTLEEILRKVPQLTIDAEGNVKLNGQSDFKVLVNGRSSAMFKNFKDVIRSMPASQIKKIEVITEPSMKYDAEGAGGIINIITARKEFDGYNGSLNYNTGLDTRQQYGGASLSATNAENQQIVKQTPSFTPKNVKSGVFVLFKIIQPLHNKRVAILKESDEKRLIFIYPFSLIFQDFTSS